MCINSNGLLRTEGSTFMGNSQNNGGSTPKIPLTSAEQNEIRRAAKARRRASGSTGRFGHLTSPHGVKKPDSAVLFRKQQAAKATEHDWVRHLSPDTTVFKLVTTALLAFPEARATTQCKRTQSAINKAITGLSSQELHVLRSHNGRQMDHAKRVIRTSLNWAYNEIQEQKKFAIA